MLEWEPCPPAPSWAAQENKKEMLLWPEEWGLICCSSVQYPNHLSHNNTFRNPFEPFQIKWEVYFSKWAVSARLYCVEYVSARICIWVCYKHIQWFFLLSRDQPTYSWPCKRQRSNHILFVCLFVCWLVGWLVFGISTFPGMFCVGVSLTIIVSEFMGYKKVSHNHFKLINTSLPQTHLTHIGDPKT